MNWATLTIKGGVVSCRGGVADGEGIRVMVKEMNVRETWVKVRCRYSPHWPEHTISAATSSPRLLFEGEKYPLTTHYPSL